MCREKGLRGVQSLRRQEKRLRGVQSLCREKGVQPLQSLRRQEEISYSICRQNPAAPVKRGGVSIAASL